MGSIAAPGVGRNRISLMSVIEASIVTRSSTRLFWQDWTTSREIQNRLFLALVAATVGISLSDWLFFGVIFHGD
jgi:hypothetical protein